MLANPLSSPLKTPHRMPMQVLAQAISRYFIELSELDNAYLETSEDLVISGDCVMLMDVYLTSAGNSMIFSGGTKDSGFELFLDGNSKFSFRYEGVNPGGLSDPATELEYWHALRVERVGSDLTLKINGVGEIVNTQVAGDLKINRFGQRVNSSSFSVNGFLANIQIYQGGDEQTGNLIADFPLDKPVPVDGIIQNRAAGNPGAPSHITGVNLLPSDSSWFEWSQSGDGFLGENVASLSSDTGLLGDGANPELISVTGPLDAGMTFLISATVKSFSGNNNCGWSTIGGVPATEPFRYTAPAVGQKMAGVITTSSASPLLLFGRLTALVIFDAISVRRLLRTAS